MAWHSSCIPSLLLLPRFFFFNDTATTEIYTLSLHDALPICAALGFVHGQAGAQRGAVPALLLHPAQVGQGPERSEEHTSELQSLRHLVCRLLLEKKKNTKRTLPISLT